MEESASAFIQTGSGIPYGIDSTGGFPAPHIPARERAVSISSRPTLKARSTSTRSALPDFRRKRFGRVAFQGRGLDDNQIRL